MIDSKKHESRVNPIMFMEGDLILKKTSYSHTNDKLSPKWVGSYSIQQVIGRRAYLLDSLDGGRILRTWNVSSLRFYYS